MSCTASSSHTAVVDPNAAPRAAPIRFELGDAIIFPSYKYHSVRAVTTGCRKTLVLEFWAGDERHCDHRVRKCGFSPVGPNWPSVYWNADKRALLVIYVDDFKLAAPEKYHDEIWASLKAEIDMDEEQDDGDVGFKVDRTHNRTLCLLHISF